MVRKTDVWVYFLSLLAWLPSALVSAADVIVNRPESIYDTRYNYPHKLLQMILDETAQSEAADNNDAPGKSDVSDQVVVADHVMSRNRLLLELIDGEDVHVVAEAPKPGWVKNLLVVRIPIRKGLQGYRLFLINQADQSALAKVASLKDLQAFPTGSGAEWSTARVMRDAGFDVVVGNNYEGLFSMLEKRRFLTFGRGVNEIESEYLSHRTTYPELEIESNLALHIKLPTYFFITPKQPELAKRIETGLKKLMANGQFDEYFDSHHAYLIEKFNLSKRKIFSIPNTNLTKDDPVDIDEYWLSL